VKKPIFFPCLAILFLGIGGSFAADPAATVTEAVNQVNHGSSSSSETKPAPVGTHLQDGEYLKTGVKSRAELELANQDVTRLGANTIFNYSVANNEVDLQAGTILFSKPKDGKVMTIKTAAVTAAIVGTTGFLQLRGHGFVFGLIEGHAPVTIDGKNYNITAGEILEFTPGSKPQILAFDVPLFLKTSPLVTKFHHPLPNQRYVDQEVIDYNDLVARGFIQPPKVPFFLTDFNGEVPTVPIPAADSAGNAQNPPEPERHRRPIINNGGGT